MIARIFSILVIFFLTHSAATEVEAATYRRIALVIGNSQYDTVGQLPNAGNDARAIAKFLRDAQFDLVDVQVDVTAISFRRALRDFTLRAADADIAVVYYAGHGMEVNGGNYLIPTDAKLDTDLDIEDETISLDRVLRAVEPAKKLRLIMLDACRENPFVPRMRRITSTRGIGRGLGEIDVATRDTLVAFAAKAGSLASDGNGSNSPFTEALIANLGKPGLDLRIAFGLVRDDVLKATSNRQEPWVYGTLGGDVLPLVPGPNNLAPGGAQAITGLLGETTEIDYTEAQHSNSAAAWQAFLRLHPSGELSDRARDKLALLTPAGAAPTNVSQPRVDTPPKAAPSPSQPASSPSQPASSPSKPASSDASPALGKDAQLVYSPWTKFCLKGQDAGAKQVCFTGKDARIESGQPVVAAVLIEPEGDTKKILRVTLPLGMQLVHGTRVIIDQNEPLTAPYVICFTNGCMADYDANADMIGKMKKGQSLTVQAINSTAHPVSLVLPLSDFAKAYAGPPTDPKVFEDQQAKLQQELQKRADDARKKLENPQGQLQSSTAPK
jgi:invasion protein IalB